MNHRGKAAAVAGGALGILCALGFALWGTPYAPVGSIVVPTGTVRAVAEKDNFAYVLTREGTLYTFDISDLAMQSAPVVYTTPVNAAPLGVSASGLLRYCDALYVAASSGLIVLDVSASAQPTQVNVQSGLLVRSLYNLSQNEHLLVTCGYGRIGLYSVEAPLSPQFLAAIEVPSDRIVFSAAIVSHTLYVSELATGTAGVFALRIVDISDPANPELIRIIDRPDVAFQLRGIGQSLVEAMSGSVSLWDVSTPNDPRLMSTQTASARFCAVDGENIVVKGSVFRIQGGQFESVSIFDSLGGTYDGLPYGSAATAEWILLAYSQGVQILTAAAQSAVELAYDDGTAEADRGFAVSGAGYAVRFTPLVGGGELLRTRIFISGFWGNPAPIEIHVWDLEHNDLIAPVQVTPTTEGWLDIDLSGYNLTPASDFFVGYLQTQANAYPWLGFDTTAPGDRSYSVPDWSRVLPAGSNAMIRVIVGPS
jgi:hypothetical protein